MKRDLDIVTPISGHNPSFKVKAKRMTLQQNVCVLRSADFLAGTPDDEARIKGLELVREQGGKRQQGVLLL